MNHQNSSLLLRATSTTAARRFTKIGAVAIAALAIGAPLVQATGIVLDTNTLDIAPNGTLNLKKGNLIVRTGVIGVNTFVHDPDFPVPPMGDPEHYLYSGITREVQRGQNFAFGYWDGYGITSSQAALDGFTAVGVLDNAYQQYGDWPRAATVDANNSLLTDDPAVNSHATGAFNEVLVKYTYVGDTDLNGVVDVDFDFGNFSLGLNDPLNYPALWQFGDFDYSGVVDQDFDYNLLLIGLAETQNGGPLVSEGFAAQSVPEPSSLMLLTGAAIALCTRRRQNKCSAN